MTSLLNSLWQDAEIAYRHIEDNFSFLWWLLVVALPLAYGFEYYLDPSMPAYIRVVGEMLVLTCAPFIPMRRATRVVLLISAMTLITGTGWSLILLYGLNGSDPQHPYWTAEFLIACFLYIGFLRSLRLVVLGWIVAQVLSLAIFFPESAAEKDAYAEFLTISALTYAFSVVFVIWNQRNFNAITRVQLERTRGSIEQLVEDFQDALDELLLRFSNLQLKTTAAIPEESPSRRARLVRNSPSEAIQEVSRAKQLMHILSPQSHAERSAIDVRLALRDAVDSYPYQNEREKALIAVEESGSFTVFGSALILVSVLHNLIKNALYEVQKANGQHVRIAILHAEKRITVTDDGFGVPDSDPTILFNALFSTKTWGNGTGIGLHFCAQAVEQMGGGVSCYNSDHGGATFCLDFGQADRKGIM